MESSCGNLGGQIHSLGKCLLTVWTSQCYIVSQHYHYAEDDAEDDGVRRGEDFGDVDDK